jgi:hypothetical protein
MATLTGEQLKDSYQSLVTIGDSITSDPTSGQLENGKGTSITKLGINTDSPSGLGDALIEVFHGTDTQLTLRNNTNFGTIFNGATVGDPTSVFSNVGFKFAIADDKNATNFSEKMRIKSSGDISFRDGSASEAFYWDASAGSLGIGTVPSTPLHVNATNANACIINVTGTSPNYIFDIRDDNVSQFRVDSSGNVGIGTSTTTYDSAKIGTGHKFLNVQAPSGSYAVGTLAGDTDINGDRIGYLTFVNENNSASYKYSAWIGAEVEGATANQQGGRLIFSTASDGSSGGPIERLLIDSDGKVGIGTLLPSTTLDVKGTMSLQATNSTNKWLAYTYTDNTLRLNYNGAGNDEVLIDSSGNVGIGTTSPLAKIHSVSAVEADAAMFSDGTYYTLAVRRLTSSTGGMITGEASSALGFGTDNTERMRIDSSGNLLVGTDTTTAGNEGMVYFNGSSLRVTRDSDEPLNLDRLTTDGSLINFKKDGSTVGSIGVTSGSFAIGQTDTGIGFFNGDRIAFPATSAGAVQDNAIDLGYSGGRFKDLYLGGSVYLGGTTSANALDDYEEGTFTPVVAGTWTANPTSLAGKYTKIGNVVHVQITFVGGTKATATSGYLEDLPFAASHGTGAVVDSGVIAQGSALFANTDRIWFTDNALSGGTNRVTGTYLIN